MKNENANFAMVISNLTATETIALFVEQANRVSRYYSCG
jgi:hypothetical protein